MTTARRCAIAAGLLFLIADAAGAASVVLSTSLHGGPNVVAAIPDHGTEIGWAALLEFVMAAACAGIAVAFYPVIRQRSPGLAIGAVAFRTAEAVVYMASAAILMSLVTLGQAARTAADPAWYGSAAALLLDLNDRIALVGLLAFSIGALCYYAAFFEMRLLPRWLTAWGLLAAVPWIGAVAWAVVAHGPENGLLVAPLGINELVLAAWLILRGFGSTVPSPTPSPAASPAALSA